MRPRTLVLTLYLVTAFWLLTSWGNWTLRKIVQPLISNGRLWSQPVSARGATFGADEQNNIDIYKANRLATVNITSIVYQRDVFSQVYPSKGIGSGFIINEDGDIITNNHVISGSPNITVTLWDKKQYPATVLGVDRRSDFALLRIRAGRKLPVVHLGDSDHLLVGQKVLAIGNPFGLEGTLTTGIVSSLGRSIDGENGNTLEGMIQTDAAINPGNSGGPLLDSHGDVIGINTAIYGSAPSGRNEAGSIGIGFASPINRAKEMLDEFHSTGQISHSVLGVSRTIFIEGDLAESLNMPSSGGLLIEGLDPGSPAAKTGLRGPDRTVVAGMYRLGVGGDLIVAIDGKPVDGEEALRRALNSKRPGEAIVLTVFRNKRSMKVTVTLGSAPEAK